MNSLERIGKRVSRVVQLVRLLDLFLVARHLGSVTPPVQSLARLADARDWLVRRKVLVVLRDNTL